MKKFDINEYITQLEQRLEKEKKEYNKRQIWNEDIIKEKHPITNLMITKLYT